MFRRICSIFLVPFSLCIGLSAEAQTPAYYRFEAGSGTDIVNCATGSIEGTTNAAYSNDIGISPIPQTGATNLYSLRFNNASATFANSGFILHSGHGNATLEFYLKAPDQVHHAIFWTRIGDDDINRFNIYINPGGIFNFDYRDPIRNSPLHGQLAGLNGVAVPVNTWTHIAIVRIIDSATQHTYRTYRNGVLMSTVTDTNPNLPTSTGWTISGRSGFILNGFVDEVRFSNVALRPDQFLNAFLPIVVRTVSGKVTLQAANNSAQTVQMVFRSKTCSPNIVRTVTLDSNGNFTLPDIPRDNYSLWIKGSKWLARAVPADVTTGDVTNIAATLPTGDANNDNFVDIADLLLLTAHYNQIRPATGYLEAADFNGDGINDIVDLLLLIANYNIQGDA